MCVFPLLDEPTWCPALTEVLIPLLYRPLLISLGELLLITPHTNLLLFHLDRQIGWIKGRGVGRGKEKRELWGWIIIKNKKTTLQPPVPLCRVHLCIPSGVMIKKKFINVLFTHQIMQKEAPPVIIEEDSFMKNHTSQIEWGYPGSWRVFSPPFIFFPPFLLNSVMRSQNGGACVCVCFLWWASNRFAIKTHFIHLCTFIYTDHVLTSQFCFNTLRCWHKCVS